MAETEDARELLFAGVIARLVWLRHAQVLHGPCELQAHERPRGHAALLWDWSRLISDVQQLLCEVLQPAMREPGRLHQRSAAIVRDRPRGVVHWPRTMQLGLRAVDTRGLRYVCNRAERNLLAPENLLLVSTLDELVARGLLFGVHDRAHALLGGARLEPLRRIRAAMREAAGTPELAAWREAASELRRSDPQAELGLEQAVRERVRGRPSAAPAWARALLDLRRHPAAMPSPEVRASIDASTLWSELALLELACSLRRRGVLRQHAGGFVGAHGLQMRPIASTPAWVIAVPGRPAVGVLRPTTSDWEKVCEHAYIWSWAARYADADIDRWLILHRSGQPTLARRRGAIELRYCDLQWDHELGSQLAPELAAWLEPRAVERELGEGARASLA